jgi:[glutamine synthetase] adenylyltransferase / [glutamine synthetase]-adenylyl-L-tyrosine phosphorylase
MQYLMRHPGVIDELADDAAAAPALRPHGLRAPNSTSAGAAWQRSGEDDEESCSTCCAAPPRRGLPHAGARRRGRADGGAGGRRPVSALADAVLDVTAALGLGAAEAAPPREPGLAVIAYGKLGGKELGYGSDLDVVFLYDDRTRPTPTARRRSTPPTCASSSPG